MTQIDADQALADGGLHVTRIEEQRTIETLPRLHITLQQKQRHATVAIGVGKIGLERDRPIMKLNRPLRLTLVHQRVTEAGQGNGEIRLQRDCALLDAASLLIASLVEQREAEIGECLCIARLDSYSLGQGLLGEFEPAGVARRRAQQLQRVETLWRQRDDLAANRLRIRMPAGAI